MQGRAFIAGLAAIASAEAVEACIVRPSLFDYDKQISDLVIEAKADIRFSEFSDARVAGEVDFRRIRCIKRPRWMGRCPSSLTVAFDQSFDGHGCGFALEGDRPGVPTRHRYFFPRASDTNGWALTEARRRRYSPE